jgi:hypothetical protein
MDKEQQEIFDRGFEAGATLTLKRCREEMASMAIIKLRQYSHLYAMTYTIEREMKSRIATPSHPQSPSETPPSQSSDAPT